MGEHDAESIERYDGAINELQREEDWAGMIELFKAQKENDHHGLGEAGRMIQFRCRVDLAYAHAILGNKDRALRMADEARRWLNRSGLDPIFTHFCHKLLARCYSLCPRPDLARSAFVRAMTFMLTKQQSEFAASSIGEIARLDDNTGSPKSAAVLHALAVAVRKERARTHRLSQPNPSRPSGALV